MQRALQTPEAATLELARPYDPTRRRDPRVRKVMSAPAMRTFLNIATEWQLSVKDQQALLGWPANSTFFKYKTGNVSTLPYDTLIRISLVLGIYKALHILFPDDQLADSWIKLPNTNPLFGGRPPLGLIVDNGMDALYQVRRLLDGRRGG